MDGPTSIRFYGDGQKEQLQKYKGKSRDRIYTAIFKGQKPKIPTLPDGDGRPVLITTVGDGSTTVLYPLCIIHDNHIDSSMYTIMLQCTAF
jgi:hypothetical protein